MRRRCCTQCLGHARLECRGGAQRRGGAPAREEVRRVHMPALRLGARVRDQYPRLLEVRLPAQQRSHHRRDARQLR